MGEVLGRGVEVEGLRGFLDAARSGPAAALVVGETGVGRSTLWNEGVSLAQESGFRVLSCRLVAAEAELAFVALSDLFGPILEPSSPPIPELPGPRSRPFGWRFAWPAPRGRPQS